HAIAAVLGSALAVSCPPAASAQEADTIEAGDTAFVDVAAATLWVEPDTDRPLDRPSTTNPVDLDEWNSRMQDTETRRWLTGKLETQAVLGSKVEVTKVSGDWAKVVLPEQATPRDERGYPGWVPTDQLVENDRFERQVEHRDRAVVTDRTASLQRPGGRSGPEISFNTELPVLHEGRDRTTVALPDGSRASLDEDAIEVYAPGEGPAAPTGEDL